MSSVKEEQTAGGELYLFVAVHRVRQCYVCQRAEAEAEKTRTNAWCDLRHD